MPLSPSLVGGASAIVLILLALAYRAILPKPIPGIPYKKASANKLLGDAPDVGENYSIFVINMLTCLVSKMEGGDKRDLELC